MTKKILVIDDEYTIRMITQTALEITAGWQVLAAATAIEGLTIAQNEHPDAILLDVMMPELNGLGVLKKLRADPLTQHIPVLFFTAKAQNGERRLLEDMAVEGLITKPFEPDAIAQDIKTLLNWSD